MPRPFPLRKKPVLKVENEYTFLAELRREAVSSFFSQKVRGYTVKKQSYFFTVEHRKSGHLR